MRTRARLREPQNAWLKPLITIAIALVLGFVLSRVKVGHGSVFDHVAFRGSEADARQLLAVVTGTMTTVTSLVFGLTLVALQLAGAQYSPRLLRSFMRDSHTQVVLSTFVGTVAYSLAGLQGVGSSGSGSVPRLAVSVSLLLALVSLALLVYYIGHVANAIRVDTVMRMVERDTLRLLERDHPVVEEGGGDPDEQVAPAGDAGLTLLAPRDGYVQGVDDKAIIRVAEREGVTVRLMPLLGYHVVRREPLAVVSIESSALPVELGAALARAIHLAPERLVERDVGLGMRQLADIATRAMGTTQNDSYTATQAVHHLTTVTAAAARRSFAIRRLRDRQGRMRVVIPVMTFPTHLKVVCGHVRQGGLERHPRVRLELLRLLGAVATAAVGEGRRAAVEQQLEILLIDARRTIEAPEDLDDAEVAGADVRARLEQARARAGMEIERGIT
jgi:uncharacterized membrane protein